MPHTAEKPAAMRPGSLPEHALVALQDGTLVPCQVIGRDAWGPGIVVDSPEWATRMSVPFDQLRFP